MRRDSAGARGALSSDTQCVRLRVSDRSASGHRYLWDDAADSDPDTDGTIGWGTIELPSLATAEQFSIAVKLDAGAEKMQATPEAACGTVWLQVQVDPLADDSAGAALPGVLSWKVLQMRRHWAAKRISP